MDSVNSLPIFFEEIKSLKNVIDDRFIPVKIWIAHTGENRNNCIFTKEVLEDMIPSLANIPILGYIAVNEDNEQDFTAHEERIVIENNTIKLKYAGHAYGMIPVDNDAHFELRYGEDGVEREYLTCNGLLWRKFKEVEEIFDRDGGFKSQSMELHPSSIEGYKDENGVFVFTKAKFEGACILGEGVTPAMVSSTIEKFSITDKIQSELSEMLIEFNAHFSAIKEKGEDSVEDAKVNIQEDEMKTSAEFTEETENTEVDNVGKTIVEEVESKNSNFESEEEPEEPNDDEETEGEEAPENESETEQSETEKTNEEDDGDSKKKTKFSLNFEMAHDDIRRSLYEALQGHELFKDTDDNWTWISKVFDNYAIVQVENYEERIEKWFKVKYVKHENSVSLGEYEELFPMFLTLAEKEQINASRNNFASLEEEVKELREFKANIELAEKEQKLSQYSDVLAKEDFETIKANISNFSIEDIEKEIGFMLLKKNHFSANEKGTDTKVLATNVENSNPYGSASVYFSK